MKDKICRLVKLVKKDVEWIKFKLPGQREIRILIKDNTNGGNTKRKVVIDCPIETKIDFEIDDEAQEISGNF